MHLDAGLRGERGAAYPDICKAPPAPSWTHRGMLLGLEGLVAHGLCPYPLRALIWLLSQ